MPIECYSDDCPDHPGDEPFCHLLECTQRFCGWCGKMLVRKDHERACNFLKRDSCDKVCGGLYGKQKQRVKLRRTVSCDCQFTIGRA